MKTKILVLMLLLVIISGNLFAQAGNQKPSNIIGANAGIIGIGLTYERLLNPKLSLVADLSYNNWLFIDGLNIGVKGRWYPFGRSYFLDLGIGYSNGYNAVLQASNVFVDMVLTILTLGIWLAIMPESNYNLNVPRENGFLLQTGMGWNVDIGRTGGFYMPLSMGLDFRFGNFTVIPYIRMGLSYGF